MKLVKEHINFERSLDPKDAMQTGNVEKREIERALQTFVDEYGGWKEVKQYMDGDVIGKLYIYNNSNVKEMYDFAIMYTKNMNLWTAMKKHVTHITCDDAEGCQQQIRYWLSRGQKYNANESLKFKRGMNPKDAMEIKN